MKYTSRTDLATDLAAQLPSADSYGRSKGVNDSRSAFYVFWKLSSTTSDLNGDVIERDNEPDPEAEFDLLDDILSALAPDITFLEYKRLMRQVVHGTAHYQEDPYTGMTVATKTLSFEHVLDTLCLHHRIALPRTGPKPKAARPSMKLLP